MKQLLLGAALVVIGTVIGALSSDNTSGTANAQFASPSGQSGDALWHLPKFGESGWFLHANNGRVRACNMDKVSVVGERAAPRCSKWTVDWAITLPMYPKSLQGHADRETPERYGSGWSQKFGPVVWTNLYLKNSKAGTAGHANAKGQ